MTTLPDLLSAQRDNLHLIEMHEKRIKKHESNLKKIHRQLMASVFYQIQRARLGSSDHSK